MAETLLDPHVSGPRRAQDQTAVNIPSRTEEGEPTIARMIGACAAVFLLAAVVMTFWNAGVAASNVAKAEALKKALAEGTQVDRARYDPSSLPFKPLFVRLWWILGIGGLILHAARDRDPLVRRSYGLFSYVLVMIGVLLGTMAVAGVLLSGWQILIPAAIVGLLLVGFIAAPFVRQELASVGEAEKTPTPGALGRVVDGLKSVAGFFPRWVQGLSTSAKVQQVTVLGVVLVAALLAAGFAVNRAAVLPYGLGALVLGLILLLTYSTNETEPAWRDAAVYLVGGIGLIAGLLGLSSVFIDLLGVKNFLLPYGLTLSVFGLAFAWAFIIMQGSETDLGYHSGLALLVLGLVVAAAAVVRSFLQTGYFVPTGFLLLALGLAYAAVGAAFSSDNRLVVMTRRELAAVFHSPIAYVVIAGAVITAWLCFLVFLNQLYAADPSTPDRSVAVPNPEPIIARYYFALFPVMFLIFSVPLLTMRLLSEEKKSGTLEVLLTAPVSEATVALSKFLGVWIFFMIAWGSWAIFPLVLRYVGQETFDYRPLLAIYLLIAFMAAGFLSMGLFFSSLTRDQISALLLTLGAMFLLTLPYFFLFVLRADRTPSAGKSAKIEVLEYISYLNHLDQFVEGKVNLENLLFYLCACVLWLFLTVKVLEARRWK